MRRELTYIRKKLVMYTVVCKVVWIAQGNNILGLGRRNLVKVTVDKFCRINLNKLEAHLQVRVQGYRAPVQLFSE